MRYRGLTWDHPRGYRALRAAAAGLPTSLSIEWDLHPLEGFESRPIAEIAKQYDLVVLDHPHVGEAVAHGCLRPLDELMPAQELARLAQRFVGPSWASYQYADRVWALPLDAASQVMALRPEVSEVPATWDDVVAARVPVALSLAGPHAFLTWASICVAYGAPVNADGEATLVRDPDVALRALELIATLTRRAPAWTHSANPIAMLEAMSKSDELAMVPLIYGYSPYRRALRFADAPSASRGGRRGSTIGGTGLAMTRRCETTPALLDHLRWLVADDTQGGFIPAHDGQPAARAAWTHADPAFYAATRATLEDSWVRPRYAGYIAFQTAGSAVIREHAIGTGERDAARVLTRLQDLYHASLPQ